jgi:GNAT superfamily N-acetyltransferase
MTAVEIRALSAQAAKGYYETAKRMHLEVYAEPLFAAHPFFGEATFTAVYTTAVGQPGFELLVARRDGVDVGYVYGYTLVAEVGWWDQVQWADGVREGLPAGYTEEDGTRTVVIPEIMVLAPYRRAGIARRLHDEFLARRKEQRAGLRVLPDNVPARTAYLAWDWRVIGLVRPVPEAPLYECMLKDLR